MSNNPKKSAGKKSAKDSKQKNVLRSSLIDDDDDASVSEAIDTAPPAPTAAATKKGSPDVKGKKDGGADKQSTKKSEAAGSTRKRDAKAQEKLATAQEGADDGQAAAAEPKKAAGKKKKAEKAKEPEKTEDGIDKAMYVRRSIRNLDSEKVNYVDPKVSFKEFDYSSSEEEEEQDQDEEQQDDGSDQGEEDGSGKKKKKGEKQKKVKEKKIRKRKFKMGKWNPDVEIARYDLYKNKPGSDLLGKDDSIAISNLNIIRAIFTDDLKLLKKIFFDRESTSTMNPVWSDSNQRSALDYMVRFNRTKMIEFILDPSFETMELHENYQDLKDSHYKKRAPDTVEFIERIDTGSVRDSAYGHQVRPVELSRGVRQGNHAFMNVYSHQRRMAHDLWNFVQSNDFIDALFRSPTTKIESIHSLHRSVPGFSKLLQDSIDKAVLYGNITLLKLIIESNIKGGRGNQQKNAIDKEFLDIIVNPDKLSDKQLKDMTTKQLPKCHNNQFWHFAALDPTGKTLERIIALNTDKATGECKILQNPNQHMYRQTFYQMASICPVLDIAACCETPKNLEILLKHKYFGFDKMHELKPKWSMCTPLHRAIMWDRAENVKFLVNVDKAKILDKCVVEGADTPIGLACKFGSLNSVKALVELGASVQRKQSYQREPPLITAATHNHFEIVEYLLDNKARVNCADMYKRTPLIVAVKNGHTRLASLILQRGADWNLADSSLNTPLHYAAAFGWIDCLELLLGAGADLNAENIWKITPIQIAMLKNRKFCIKKLLEQEGVKVNCTDLSGRTLLSVTLFNVDHQTEELIQKIIEIGGDPNIADLQKNTPLHHLALFYEQKYKTLKEKKDKDDLNERMAIIGKQLLDAGADINAINSDKLTVFAIAIKSRNIKLIEAMVSKLSIDEDKNLLFNFCGPLLLDSKYTNIIKLIVEAKKPSKAKINFVNDDGFTPLLMFYKDFTMHYRVAFSKVLQKLMPLIKTRGKEFESYSEFDSLEKILEIYKDSSSQNFSDSALSDEEKSVCLSIAQQLIEKHLVLHFVEMVKVLVDNGANPSLTVGQVKEKKKESEDPLIAEAKKQYFKDYGWDFDQESTDEDELTEQDKKIRKKRLKIKKKVEEDESSKYNIYGKKNIWHFAADMPSIYFSQTVFDQLLSFNIDIEAKDLNEFTPVMLQVRQRQANYIKELRSKFFDMAIHQRINVNLPDAKGVTYFQQLVNEEDHENAYKFYEAGANPNIKSKDGRFALLTVFQKNDLALLKEFCSQIEKRGSKIKRPTHLNVHLIDDNKRNFMHFAMNSSQASIDASFKTLRYILDLKVDYNAIDKDGRTPLHYAFCKIDESHTQQKSIDPIEIVSNMLAIEDLDLNVQDKWGKTPLHYACRYGSTMSAIYMLQRGADLNLMDIFGNKPLGIALIYNQWNLATILIQKDGDMSQTVQTEDYERQWRIWRREELKEKRERRQAGGGRNQILSSSLVEPEDDDQFETDEEEEHNLEQQFEKDQKPLPSQSIFKLTISKNQNALAYMTLSSYDNTKAVQDAIECKQFNLVYKILEKIPTSKKLSSVSNKDGQNLFQILFSNFDQAYFSEDKKLLEFIDILKKRGVDIKIKDNKGQQILHQVCESQNKRLIKLLLKNFKFDVNMRDKDQNTPFFLYFKKLQLTHDVNRLKYDEIFTSMVKDYGADINALYPYGDIFRSIKETDKEEDQYVQRMIDIKEWPSKAPKDIKVTSYMCPILYYYILRDIHGFNSRQDAIKELVELGAKFTERDSEGRDAYMLTAIRNHNKILEYLFGLSEKAGKETDAIDNKGWTAAHYVVKPLIQGSYENEKMLKLFRDAKFKMDHPDEDDMTPADYAKEQQSQKLYKAFIKLKLLAADNTDKDKKSIAQDASVLQEDEKMEDEDLSQIVDNKDDAEMKDDDDQIKEKAAKEDRMKSLVLKANKYVPTCPIPFEKHANTYIKANEQKYKIKLDQGEDFERHEQYERWYLGKQFRIFKGKPYVDEEPKKKAKKKQEDEEMIDEEELKAAKEAKIAKMEEQEYSVFLTKSNIENFFGQYLFYKMQLLYDTNQGVHIVLTRWGEMGQIGMHQRTPFETLNKAKIEFHKIFKEKTGNDFENLKKFQRVEKKYNLTKQKTEAFNYKELLINFDWNKVPKSKLDKKVRGLIRSFAHPGYYRLQMRGTSINTDCLPISSIKPQVIQDAKKILNDLEKKIMKDHQLQTSGLGGGNFAIKLKVMEEIYELTNRYFELIPSRAYSEWQQPAPLTTLEDIKEQFEELNRIDYICQMSKIYLGALSQQYKQNPLDYIYKIFNTEFKLLDKKTIEYKMLLEYIENTWQNHGNQQITNVFTVNKEGEEQAIREFHDLSNQKLLFHGSSTQNFVGIFYQGMQIQHSGTRTGQLLGPNALYFADRFDKAFMYARNEAFDDPNCSNASKLVLICEVALGKTNQLCSYKNVTMLGPGYSSVKLRGKEELDMYKEVRLDNGLKVPQGQLMNIISAYMPNLQFYVNNMHSEYTVYRPDQVKIKYVVQIKKKRAPEKRKLDKETMLKQKIEQNTKYLSKKQIDNVIKTLKI